MVLPRYIVEGLKVAIRHLLDAAWRLFYLCSFYKLKKILEKPEQKGIFDAYHLEGY